MSIHELDTPENGFVVHVPRMITVHCADSPNGKVYEVERMRKDHLLRGFKDVAYHLIIQPNGDVDNGRPLNIVGSHVAGHNTGNLGICLVGNDKFSRAQWTALRGKLDALFQIYDIKKTELHCHYQFDTAIKQGKTCPNFKINILLLWYFQHLEKAIEQNLLP